MKNSFSGLFGIICIFLLIAYFLYPLESVNEGEEVDAVITHYFPTITKTEAPKPYYLAKLSNGVSIKIQDYGQVKAVVGDKVKIKKYTGKVTKINTYVLIGKY